MATWQGESMDQALSEMNMVVSCIYTIQPVYHLAKEKMWYANYKCVLYRVGYLKYFVKECAKDLMERDKNSNKNVKYYTYTANNLQKWIEMA